MTGSADSPTSAADDARYGRIMWDVLTWHHGTLAVAWWAVLIVIFLALVAAGGHAAKR